MATLLGALIFVAFILAQRLAAVIAVHARESVANGTRSMRRVWTLAHEQSGTAAVEEAGAWTERGVPMLSG